MNHEVFMRRCFQLAKLGKGKVSPNPMVGCVVVKNGKIISEGYHKKYGEAHAEVNALKNLGAKDLEDATVYVSLEPCSHYGKTGPCCELLHEKGVKNLVVASQDPNPKVSGSGLRYLEERGVKVTVRVLDEEQQKLNKAFWVNQLQKRPYIILKWAESSDGYIGKMNGEGIKISSDASKNFVHQLRNEVDGILVGKRTLINDNPKLDCRFYSDKQLRKVLFSSNKIHTDQGYSVINPSTINEDLNNLYNENIGSILVEGGKQTLQFFIDHNLFDETYIIKNPIEINEGVTAPKINNKSVSSFHLGVDKIYHYIK